MPRSLLTCHSLINSSQLPRHGNNLINLQRLKQNLMRTLRCHQNFSISNLQILDPQVNPWQVTKHPTTVTIKMMTEKQNGLPQHKNLFSINTVTVRPQMPLPLPLPVLPNQCSLPQARDSLNWKNASLDNKRTSTGKTRSPRNAKPTSSDNSTDLTTWTAS